MMKYKTILFAGILTSIFLSLNSAKAFHKDVYYPRAPEALLEILQDMDNPFPPTKKNI